MDRRKFLKSLGLGAAAVVAAPIVISECADPWCGSIAGEGIIPHDELHGADAKLFGDILCASYADCTSFSEFAIANEFDDDVMRVAEELGRAHARRVSALYQAAV